MTQLLRIAGYSRVVGLDHLHVVRRIGRSDQSRAMCHCPPGSARPFRQGERANPNGSAAPRVRADRLFQLMLADFGELSATDQILLRRAASLLARSERVLDSDAAVRLTSEGRASSKV
jgi:hypothetical protein